MSASQQVASKVTTPCTYADSKNYWAPLADADEEDDTVHQELAQLITINNSGAHVPQTSRSTINTWLTNRIRRQTLPRGESSMVLDSGATSHFVRPEEDLSITGLSNKIVNLPDGSTIQATHTATLPFDALSPQARQADVLPGLRPNSLVSVGKLADANYTTIFHPKGKGVTVHHNNSVRLKLLRKPVLQGWRDSNGLWRLSRDQSKQLPAKKKANEQAANVYSLPSIEQTIRYLHAAAGFPTKDTWVKAIKQGNYETWPRLTVEAVSKHFPESVETQKGHMQKQRQNVRSTKQKICPDDTSDDTLLTQAVAKHNVMVKIVNANETVYSDQTGRLPVQSSRGNTSLMVYYDVDSNYIDAEPIRSHQDSHMIQAYRTLWTRTTRGRANKPHLHILDNEASEAFKAAIKENCTLQLVPPDTHRRNLAERAIQTFKSHFISILAFILPDEPMGPSGTTGSHDTKPATSSKTNTVSICIPNC